MATRRWAVFLVALACALASGCASPGGSMVAKPPAAGAGADDHADLERELSLYSD